MEVYIGMFAVVITVSMTGFTSNLFLYIMQIEQFEVRYGNVYICSM